jgi:hypothetical protein
VGIEQGALDVRFEGKPAERLGSSTSFNASLKAGQHRLQITAADGPPAVWSVEISPLPPPPRSRALMGSRCYPNRAGCSPGSAWVQGSRRGSPANRGKPRVIVTAQCTAEAKLRWRGWGSARAVGIGKGRFFQSPCTSRRIESTETRSFPGDRIELTRLRLGFCASRVAWFYTRARYLGETYELAAACN